MDAGRSAIVGGLAPPGTPEYSSNTPPTAKSSWAAAACARPASSERARASAHALATVGVATSAKSSITALASVADSAAPPALGVPSGPSPDRTPVATIAWYRHSATTRRSFASHSARLHSRPLSSSTSSSRAVAANGSLFTAVCATTAPPGCPGCCA